jgi:hypothetical protein
MATDVQVFHKDDAGFLGSVERGAKYLISTRSGHSDRPQIHTHRTGCGVWRRGAGSTGKNGYTRNSIKVTSNSLTALDQYAHQNWPGRPRHVCSCVRRELAEALASNGSSDSSDATPTDKPERSEVPSPPAHLTVAAAKEALSQTCGVPPEAIEITIRG